MMPRQFGPISLIPYFFAARSAASASDPAPWPRAVSGQFESVLPIGGSLTPANQIRSSLSVAARTIMAKGYSTDLRARAVALIEAGESRREVARLLDLAASP